ncbi:GntR family transcriptional regulator [Streptomyces sp. NPDC021212]|uniref:GntR family transcriptional regulator n=1 Tax=Streptomyces sp. NPDC021212 TaxID=3365118 RepID=UPI00379EDEC7
MSIVACLVCLVCLVLPMTSWSASTTAPSSSTDEAGLRIRERLPSGTLPPGTQLSERQLATELGMSRTPVREALTRLERDGLVMRGRGGAGAFVNLAGYLITSVRADLSSRASGLFITAIYVPAAFAGYLLGQLAGYTGWRTAGLLQLSALSVLAGLLCAFGLRPERFSRPAATAASAGPAPHEPAHPDLQESDHGQAVHHRWGGPR